MLETSTTSHKTHAVKNGFTLIELLVVVTIIVVLLALLVPALDKAIYQAELAVCGARHKAVGHAVSVYAMDHRRTYPHRAGVHHPDTNYYPQMLTLPSAGVYVNQSGQTFDDRPMLRPYMTINTFNDPLMSDVDYDGIPAERGINAANNLWAGFGFDGQKGMFRVGDRWSWGTGALRVVSSVLYMDQLDAGTFAGGFVYSSHPDSNGVMSEYLWDDETARSLADAGVPYGAGNMQAGWSTSDLANVGTFDRHFAYADGSVRRLTDSHWNPAVDPHLEKAGGNQTDDQATTAWKAVPKN